MPKQCNQVQSGIPSYQFYHLLRLFCTLPRLTEHGKRIFYGFRIFHTVEDGSIKQEIANTYSSSSHVQEFSWVRGFIREGKEITDVVNTSHLLHDKLRLNCFWKNSLSLLFNKGPYFGRTAKILLSCFFP